MQIMGVQAATGMVIEEAGFQQDVAYDIPQDPQAPSNESVPEVSDEFLIEDWNTPGTSSQPTVTPPSPPTEARSQSSPVAPVEDEWKPPPRKKTKNRNDLFKKIIESDIKAREYARERDRVYEEMEKERLRLKNEELRVQDYEIRERVRQRDVELQLQGAWLDFMKKALEVIVRYMEEK